MKVKCINTGCWKYITIGKIYEVIKEDEDVTTYWLKNDRMSIGYYDKNLFKSLYEIRNEKIDRLLR